MQFSLAFLASLALAGANVSPRQQTGGYFTLSNVSFTSTTFSKGGGTSHYTFAISDSSSFGGSTTCAKAFSNNQELPPTNLTACADPTWSFALNKTGSTAEKGQYVLYVTRYQVIDGHRTNNETSCNTNNTVLASPNQNPQDPGAVFELSFGGQTFEEDWEYTSPTRQYCPTS